MGMATRDLGKARTASPSNWSWPNGTGRSGRSATRKSGASSSISRPSPCSPWPGNGFEDWGYHELNDAGDGFLRHEILFSSGAVVLIEFRAVSVERIDRPQVPPPR
jgi:hypothetical protein